MLKPEKCGGDLVSTFSYIARGMRAGDIQPCPWCGKQVKLRHPFNRAEIGAYLQIPMHNRSKT